MCSALLRSTPLHSAPLRSTPLHFPPSFGGLRPPHSLRSQFASEKSKNSAAFVDAKCDHVNKIINHTNHPATYMRMIHNDCMHCEWKEEHQWLDIDNDWDVRASEPKNSDRFKITRSMIYPTYPCKMEGINVRCPASPWKYLDSYYGKSWKTPTYTSYENGEWKANEAIKNENVHREEAGAASASVAAASSTLKVPDKQVINRA